MFTGGGWSLSLGMARDGVIASTQRNVFHSRGKEILHKNVIGESTESLLALLIVRILLHPTKWYICIDVRGRTSRIVGEFDPY